MINEQKIKVGDTVIFNTNHTKTWKEHRNRYKIVKEIYNMCGKTYDEDVDREDYCDDDENTCKYCKFNVKRAKLNDDSSCNLSDLTFYM